VKAIVDSLKTPIDRLYLVVTRVENGLEPLREEIEATGLELLGTVPLDQEIIARDLAGRPLVDLPEGAPAVQAVRRLLEQVGL
ncbi:MAG: carbon monoxide dehydrogenase, partial [Clostridia bacterium]|nr:carbon monoxide dehydrogenase [Clostridia bacterium]